MKKLIKILSTTCIGVCLLSSTLIQPQAAETTKYGSSQAIDNNYLSAKEEKQLSKSIPTSYNSNELGYVTSVKNQGNSDTCWAYASTSTFESLLLRNSLFTVDLEPKHMDLWATPTTNGLGWQRKEDEGGYTYIPLGYYSSWNGAVDINNSAPTQGTTALIYLGKNDTELIKKTIMDSGAVTANFAVNSKGYSKNYNSYYLGKKNNNIYGHTVSVVGWDDNYSKENFDGSYTPTNNGAWLCKNSWGSNINSIGGYLWISYEDVYIFDNDVFSPSYGIKEFVDIKDNLNLYQNEEYGATYEFEYLDEKSKDITYFNVFDFSEKGNVLNKVIFETTAVGASYKTYFVPLKDEKPTLDKSCWQQLSSGTIDYAGYICDDVQYIAPQSKGAVAVEVDTSGCNSTNSVGVDEWLTDVDNTMIFEDKLKNGKSFVLYNDNLVDVKNYYKDNLNDDIGGNLVIKAITDEKYNINYGEINKDNTFNIRDATALQYYLVKKNNFNIYQKANADVNRDGKINILDVTKIQRTLAFME